MLWGIEFSGGSSGWGVTCGGTVEEADCRSRSSSCPGRWVMLLERREVAGDHLPAAVAAVAAARPGPDCDGPFHPA